MGSPSGSLAVNGGTLDLNAFSVLVGSLNGNGGLITNSNASATSVLAIGQGGSYAGNIQDGSGAIGLSLPSGGILALSGTDSLSGGIDNAGILTLCSAGSLNLPAGGAFNNEPGAVFGSYGAVTIEGTLINQGTFSVSCSVWYSSTTTAGTCVFNGGYADNAGTFAVTDGGAVTVGSWSGFTNQPGASLTINAGGEFTSSRSTVENASGAQITNEGTFTLSGSFTTLNGAVTASSTLTNDGIIINSGTLSNGGTSPITAYLRIAARSRRAAALREKRPAACNSTARPARTSMFPTWT